MAPEGGGNEESIPLPDSTGEVWVDLTATAESEPVEATEELVETGEGEVEAGSDPSGPTGGADEEAEATEEVTEPAVEGAPAKPAEAEGEDAETEAEAEAEAPEGDEEAPSEPPSEPFAFKVDGVEVEVPGAVVARLPDEDGEEQEMIVVPRSQWQSKIQPRLVDRGAVLRRERELERKVQDLDPSHHPDVVKARELMRVFDEEILADQDSLADFLTNFELHKVRLKSRLENLALKKESEVRTKKDEQVAEDERVERLARTMADDFPKAVDGLLGRVRERVEVPDSIATAFREKVARNLHDFYGLADAETARQLGIEEGSLYRDDERLVGELSFLMKAAGVTTEGSGNGAGGGDDEARSRAERKNRAALEGGNAPSTPSPKETPTPSPTDDAAPSFKSKEQWREWGMGVG